MSFEIIKSEDQTETRMRKSQQSLRTSETPLFGPTYAQ